MRHLRIVLSIIIVLALALGCAFAEGGDLYAVDHEKLVIVDQDGLKISLTGEYEAIDKVNGKAGNFMSKLKCVIENNTGATIGVEYTGIVNGWNIDSFHTMNGATSLPDGTKAKSDIWFTTEDCDVTCYEDLETMQLNFHVKDEDRKELFTASTGVIHFHASGTPAGETPAGEGSAEVAPSVEPVPAEPAESLIALRGIFTANFSEAYKADTAQPGMVDCLAIFDFANDAQNRRLPEDAGEITLDINGTNRYDIVRTNMANCAYFTCLSRYTGYASPLEYGNLLGGAEPVRMMALFCVNPNDFNGAGDITLTVGDQAAAFPAANVRAIDLPNQVLSVEEDSEAAQRIADWLWRMDSAVYFARTISTGNGYTGEDFNGVSKAMLNLFDESIPYGIDLGTHPSGGFTSIDGIYFDGGRNTLTSMAPAFDIDAVKAAIPEKAGLVQYLINQNNALAEAAVKANTGSKALDELLWGVTDAYLDFCEYFGIMDAGQDIASRGGASGIVRYLDNARSQHRPVSEEAVAAAQAEADAIRYGNKEIVKAVQQALNDAGFDCGTPDGAAGKKTASAISAYQEAHGLEVTGTINRELVEALGVSAD